MKFAPLENPLNSAQMYFKTASFGEGTKAVKFTHMFYNGLVVLCLTANLWWTYMAALQYYVFNQVNMIILYIPVRGWIIELW